MNTPTIRVILVDDHRRVHLAITEMFLFFDDLELIAQATNGQEAITLVQEHQPDVILMDIMMPVMDGIQATEQILSAFPNIKIIALSSFQDDDSVYSILQAGAVGYILKNENINDIDNIIRSAYQGQNILSPEILHKLMHQSQTTFLETDLSERELQVLTALAKGQTNAEIAKLLTISVSTVKFHMNNIQLKLGVETRAEALVVAAKNRLI